MGRRIGGVKRYFKLFAGIFSLVFIIAFILMSLPNIGSLHWGEEPTMLERIQAHFIFAFEKNLLRKLFFSFLPSIFIGLIMVGIKYTWDDLHSA